MALDYRRMQRTAERNTIGLNTKKDDDKKTQGNAAPQDVHRSEPTFGERIASLNANAPKYGRTEEPDYAPTPEAKALFGNSPDYVAFTDRLRALDANAPKPLRGKKQTEAEAVEPKRNDKQPASTAERADEPAITFEGLSKALELTPITKRKQFFETDEYKRLKSGKGTDGDLYTLSRMIAAGKTELPKEEFRAVDTVDHTLLSEGRQTKEAYEANQVVRKQLGYDPDAFDMDDLRDFAAKNKFLFTVKTAGGIVADVPFADVNDYLRYDPVRHTRDDVQLYLDLITLALNNEKKKESGASVGAKSFFNEAAFRLPSFMSDIIDTNGKNSRFVSDKDRILFADQEAAHPVASTVGGIAGQLVSMKGVGAAMRGLPYFSSDKFRYLPRAERAARMTAATFGAHTAVTSAASQDWNKPEEAAAKTIEDAAFSALGGYLGVKASDAFKISVGVRRLFPKSAASQKTAAAIADGIDGALKIGSGAPYKSPHISARAANAIIEGTGSAIFALTNAGVQEGKNAVNAAIEGKEYKPNYAGIAQNVAVSGIYHALTSYYTIPDTPPDKSSLVGVSHFTEDDLRDMNKMTQKYMRYVEAYSGSDVPSVKAKLDAIQMEYEACYDYVLGKTAVAFMKEINSAPLLNGEKTVSDTDMSNAVFFISHAVEGAGTPEGSGSVSVSGPERPVTAPVQTTSASESEPAGHLTLKATEALPKGVMDKKVGTKENPASQQDVDNVKYSFVGRTEDGRGIYKTDYPKGTPKKVKQDNLIGLVQNLWSGNPVTLPIGAETITANFDPELSERSDLAKIAFGNNKGTASDRRVTLDLSADFYQIAQDARYTGSQTDSGKNTPAHKGVREWKYFVTDLVYEDEDGNRSPYHMNIDVKQKDNGNWFYSFRIEKGTAPQTLLAAVAGQSPTTVPNSTITQPDGFVNTQNPGNLHLPELPNVYEGGNEHESELREEGGASESAADNRGERAGSTEAGREGENIGNAESGRTAVLSGSGGRDVSVGAGIEAGGLGESTGGRAPSLRQIQAADRRRRDAADLRKVSPASLGITRGAASGDLAVLPEEYVRSDEELSAVSDGHLRDTGFRPIFVVGRIGIAAPDGRVKYVRGVYRSDGPDIIQADDNKVSAERIADHEKFHRFGEAHPGLYGKAIEAVRSKYGEDAFRRVMTAYVKNLEGIIVEEDMEADEDGVIRAVAEEILADAYAGINAFGANADAFTETVRPLVNRETGIEKTKGGKPSSPRAPPASSKEAEVLRSLKEAVESGVMTQSQARAIVNGMRKNGGLKTAAEAKQKLSIADAVDEDGNEYENVVVLDTDIFKGARTAKEKKARLEEYVYTHLAGKKIPVTDSDGNTFEIEFARENERVKKEGAKNSHPVLGKLTQNYDRNGQLASAHADEIVYVSKSDPSNEDNLENTHQWMDENGWTFRTATLVLPDGSLLEANLNIAKARDGRSLLYSINNIRSIKKAAVDIKNIRSATEPLNALLRTQRPTIPDVDGIITQPDGFVKRETKTRPVQKTSYGGESASDAPLSDLERAREMENDDYPNPAYFKETGWFRGRDQRWKFEIDDSKMRVFMHGDATYADDPEYAEYNALFKKVIGDAQGTSEDMARLKELDGKYRSVPVVSSYNLTNGRAVLSDLLVHDELFRQYPSLRDVKVRFADIKGQEGSYSPSEDTITLSSGLRKDEDQLKSVLIHEIQHAIQEREGFAAGASPSFWEKRNKERMTPELRAEEAGLRSDIEAIIKRMNYIEDRSGYTDFADDLFQKMMNDEISPEECDRLVDTYEKEHLPPEYRHLEELLEEKRNRLAEIGKEIRDPMDLYYGTVGEIEARDVQNRLGMSAEERRETMPYLGGKDVYFAERGADAYYATENEYDEETASIKEQLVHSQSEIEKMKSVCSIKTPALFVNKQQAIEYAVRELRRWNYEVDRENFGTIHFNEKDIRKAGNYADSNEEKAAILAVPYVLKRGIIIGQHNNHKDRKKETITFGAPVEINGQRGHMAVVVNRNGNHYYVSRILNPDGSAFVFQEKEAEQESYQGVRENTSLANTTSSASEHSIAQPDGFVKSKYSADEGVSEAEPDRMRYGDLAIQTMYKSASKKGSPVTAENANALSFTSETTSAKASMDSIADDEQIVKSKYSADEGVSEAEPDWMRYGEDEKDGKEIDAKESADAYDVEEKEGNKDFSYDALVSQPDIQIVPVQEGVRLPLTDEGIIDHAAIMAAVRGKSEEIRQGSATPRYAVSVPAIGGKAEITSTGMKHGYFDGLRKGKSVPNAAKITAKAEMMLPEVLENSIEVNRLEGRGNPDVPYSSVLLGVLADKTNGETTYYAVRSVIEIRKGQNPMMTEYGVVGSLYAANAKEVSGDNDWDTGNPDVARTYSTLTSMSIAQLLENVKTVFPDTFSNDVYRHLGVQREETKFSSGLKFSAGDDTETEDDLLAWLTEGDDGEAWEAPEKPHMDFERLWEIGEEAGRKIADDTKPEDLITARQTRKRQSAVEKAAEAWSFFKRKWVDQGDTVTSIGKLANDASLYAYFNMARSSTNAAARMITDKATDVMGKPVGKGLNEIFDPIRGKGDGYYNDFQLYLFHAHNVDRMSRFNQKVVDQARAAFQYYKETSPELTGFSDYQIEQMAYDEASPLNVEARGYVELLNAMRRAENTRNKPVFGWDVDAAKSKAEAKRLLDEHPEFESMAKEVYAYCDNLLRYRVDSGLITEEDYKRFKTIYPHYVPTFRLYEGTKAYKQAKNAVFIGKTVGRAEGGKTLLMPIHRSLARKTMSVVREGSKNRFGVRLMDTVASGLDGKTLSQIKKHIQDVQRYDVPMEDEPFDGPGDETLSRTNTFVVRDGGKMWEMMVSPALFDAVKAISPDAKESNIFLRGMRAQNDLFKKLVTSWNPGFIARNFLKDAQDALLYSKHAGATAKQYPAAWKEIVSNGAYWQRYLALGGMYGSFFDYDRPTESRIAKSAVGQKAKAVGSKVDAVHGVQWLNEMIEQAPRFAEFMATVKKAGGLENASMDDLMQAMHDAADVTVNFGRGGEWAKFLNQYVIPFFNPSIQGFSKAVRNVTERKGFKAWANLILKAGALGLAPAIINALLYDGDEDYEVVRDRDKDGYFLFKTGDGQWIRIPYGRTASVLGAAGRRVFDMMNGKEADWKEWIGFSATQVAPSNPFEQNLFKAWFDADLLNTDSPGRTWYGTDIESKRLQNLAPGERYDSRTDAISKWLGKQTGLSPKKINYLLDQYSGAVGDVLLPYLTPTGEGNLLAQAAKPFVSGFTLDSVISNRLSNDFYAAVDEATYAKNSEAATAEDAAIYRYMTKQQSAVSDVNKAIRAIEADGTLSAAEKKELLRAQYAIRNGIEKAALERLGEYKEAVKAAYAASGAEDEGDRTDEAYREANRTVFGAEYALSVYNKQVYEKALRLNGESGIGFDEFYDVYFGMKAADDLSGAEASSFKRDVIDASPLSDAKKAALYGEYVSESRTADIDAFADAGMDFHTFVKVNNAYAKIGEEYDKAGDKATAFSKWINDEGFSAAEKRVIVDSFGYYAGAQASSSKYDRLVAAGFNGHGSDVAFDVLQKFSSEMSAYDENGNGSYTNAEIKAAIDGIFGAGAGKLSLKKPDGELPQLSLEQKGMLWQIFSGSTSVKNNPYSQSGGQKVLDAKAAEKKEASDSEMPAGHLSLKSPESEVKTDKKPKKLSLKKP